MDSTSRKWLVDFVTTYEFDEDGEVQERKDGFELDDGRDDDRHVFGKNLFEERPPITIHFWNKFVDIVRYEFEGATVQSL